MNVGPPGERVESGAERIREFAGLADVRRPHQRARRARGRGQHHREIDAGFERPIDLRRFGPLGACPEQDVQPDDVREKPQREGDRFGRGIDPSPGCPGLG